MKRTRLRAALITCAALTSLTGFAGNPGEKTAKPKVEPGHLCLFTGNLVTNINDAGFYELICYTGSGICFVIPCDKIPPKSGCAPVNIPPDVVPPDDPNDGKDYIYFRNKENTGWQAVSYHSFDMKVSEDESTLTVMLK